MHSLAHLVIASKAEGDIRDATAHLGMRQIRLDPARGIDEVNRVVVMLLHARRDSENIRIENNVFGRKANLVDQYSVGTLAHSYLVLVSRGLPLFVEGHHYDRRAIFQNLGRILPKLLLAFFQRDRIDDAFTLQAFQSRLDDLPFRGVDHERHFGNFGLAPEQLQEARHCGDAIDHAFVHADVENIRTILDLLPRDAYRFLIFALFDQLRELRRPGHIGPLADHDVDAGLLSEWLRSREAERLCRIR